VSGGAGAQKRTIADWALFSPLLTQSQALLDMWAAIHTSEAAAAACAQLDIPAPSLLDDARLSIRDPRVLGLTYTHWHAHISSGVSSVKNAWLPQAEWTSVTARTCVTSMNLQRNFLPMISPATLHPLASSITTLLLDHNPIACFPLNMRSCTAMTLLSCCHARLAYVPALPPNLLSLRLHDNRLLQVRTFFSLKNILHKIYNCCRCLMTSPTSNCSKKRGCTTTKSLPYSKAVR
jgi:hypothetical protein